MYRVTNNKVLTDSTGLVVKDILDQIVLTKDIVSNAFIYSKYVKAVNSNLSEFVTRLYLLNEDETVQRDVSEYLLSGNLSYNYQQGQTHSLNITLYNADNFWVVHPVLGNIYPRTKFRFDIGLYSQGTVYWRNCGIFAVKDVSISPVSDHTISLQLYDKFALLDGTIEGKVDSDFVIPVGTSLTEALNMCLVCEDELGNPYDTKSIIYESDLSTISTPYTINKTAETSMGEIIIELANMVSHDVFYNEFGNLTLRPGTDGFDYNMRPVEWYYNEDDLNSSDPKISINYGDLINKVTVFGAINNGYQFKGIAKNTNPLSPSNINIKGNIINPKIIEDSNIYSDDLALERAEYELNKYLLAYTKSSFTSVFVPHLLPKSVVMWNSKQAGVRYEKYIIQSLSYNFGEGFLMNIEMSNMKEMGVNE